MSKKETNIEQYTRQLIQKAGQEQPSVDFTKKVMQKVLMEPSVNYSASFSLDDKKSKIWLFLSIASMFVGYIFFFFFKNDFNLDKSLESFSSPHYFNLILDFFKQVYFELSFSPYVLLGLAGVIVLIVIDQSIVKFLHSL
ncbi:MAG: hypothetical protein V2I54_05660 [Bacteroidales bacterium]|jgi:hypothetical protein|nr:hypothetical protein [Bacteroidales bacterium]